MRARTRGRGQAGGRAHTNTRAHGQAGARARGQPASHVYIYHILTRGTFDERLVSLLSERDVTQDRITDAVKWYVGSR